MDWLIGLGLCATGIGSLLLVIQQMFFFGAMTLTLMLVLDSLLQKK